MQTTIYIGLNDSVSDVQKHDTKMYISILKNVCHNYKVAFSVHQIAGGYFHEDGHYTEEKTLVLLLLDVPQATTTEIAKDLCAFFNQESVMVTYSPCKAVFIHEHLDVDEEQGN